MKRAQEDRVIEDRAHGPSEEEVEDKMWILPVPEFPDSRQFLIPQHHQQTHHDDPATMVRKALG
jgi:hypothetical protein